MDSDVEVDTPAPAPAPVAAPATPPTLTHTRTPRGLRASPNTVRTVSVALFFAFMVLLVWEAWVMVDGQPSTTVSASLRDLNRRTKWLFAITTALLWLHLFLPFPSALTQSNIVEP